MIVLRGAAARWFRAIRPCFVAKRQRLFVQRVARGTGGFGGERDQGGEHLHDLVDQVLVRQFAEREARPAVRLFVRRDASESVVRQRAGQFSHIHLASHGEFSSDNPLGSRLKLAADERNDGMLTVSEIYGLPLRAHMVVLSACETNVACSSSACA